MQQDDAFQLISVIAKLNRTIDGQKEILDMYLAKYGPINMSETEQPIEPTPTQEPTPTPASTDPAPDQETPDAVPPEPNAVPTTPQDVVKATKVS